jgi:hypothetical protein
MKVIKLIIVGAMLLFGSIAVQADMQTPEILSSVSKESMHVLSKAESDAVRGEYITCHYYRGVKTGCSIDTKKSHIAQITVSGDNLWIRTAKKLSLGSKEIFVSR